MAGDATTESEGAARRTQAERVATASRRMLRAAIGRIAKQGYTKTTLAQIGRDAGYTGGLVSHHFGSKEGLLRELVGRITGRFYGDQVAPAIEGKTGIEALCSMGDTYLQELTVREERMRALYVLMGEALGPVSAIQPVFAELNRGFRENVAKHIREGMERGEIRTDLDPATEAAAFVGTLRGVALQWMTDMGSFDLDAVRASVLDSLRRHLEP